MEALTTSMKVTRVFNGLQWVSTISSSIGDCYNRSLSAANGSVWRDEEKTYSYEFSGKAVRANTLPALGAPPTASEVLEVAESSALVIDNFSAVVQEEWFRASAPESCSPVVCNKPEFENP